ncbi:DNA adenine methylase, partial [Candidatus Viridilinea mediisalina]
MFQQEDPKYLQSELITYIGNKRGLLPFINEGVTFVKERLGKDKLIFLDLFSGSGVVSRFMKAHAERIVANDIELYAKIAGREFLQRCRGLNHRGTENTEQGVAWPIVDTPSVPSLCPRCLCGSILGTSSCWRFECLVQKLST